VHALHAISVSDWNEVCPLSVAASVSTSNVLASAPPLSGLHSTDCSLLRQSVSIDLHARPANSRIRGYTDRSSLGRAGLTVLSNTQLVWIWLVVRVGISVGWLHMSSCLFFVLVFFSPFQPLSGAQQLPFHEPTAVISSPSCISTAVIMLQSTRACESKARRFVITAPPGPPLHPRPSYFPCLSRYADRLPALASDTSVRPYHLPMTVRERGWLKHFDLIRAVMLHFQRMMRWY